MRNKGKSKKERHKRNYDGQSKKKKNKRNKRVKS